MLSLKPGETPLSTWRKIMEGEKMTLDPSCWANIQKGHDIIQKAARGNDAIYGVNTGFGKLAHIRIPSEKLKELQINIIRSHCAGVGDPLPREVVRLALALKAASLAQGASGVQQATVKLLLELLNNNILPVIPSQGSVGASGDLAPLAHMSAVLIGEGEANVEGIILKGAEALRKANLTPLELREKEGLALLNGTQISTALALYGYFALEQCFFGSLVVGALSTDAIAGSDVPFHAGIHHLRKHEGQIKSAKILRELIEGSEIRRSHLADDPRVQDPYSIRCQPQVMGAAWQTMKFAAETLLNESNAVTDNPLILLETGEILSGGNFHAEPVAFAADILALAAAEIGNIAQRRCAMLVDPVLSGLPAFLVSDPGLNSGFMIAEVTSAALASENRFLASPCVIDTIPTSANQEDHVSMATHAARRLMPMAQNLAHIIGIEALLACQGLDLRSPLKTSEALQKAYHAVREVSPKLEKDRVISGDINNAAMLIRSRYFIDLWGETLFSEMITE
jgi:histidine ammonia-lyase